MASIYSRSSKRPEGLTTRSGTRTNVATPPRKGNHNTAHSRHPQSNIGRKKRPRDSIEDGEHALKPKRARFAVEISVPSNLQLQPQQPETRSLVISSNASSGAAPPAPQRCASPKHVETATQTTALPLSPPRKPADHHQKVANGIKHELDRLQPNAADLKAEKRKLRSQEGARFKSELSAYFPEYDEVIGNEPKEAHILNLDTPIIIVDSAKTSTKPPPPPQEISHVKSNDYPLKDFSNSLFTDLHDAQRVDFSLLVKNYKDEGGEDPLSDEHFELIHRKPERQEKAIRNSDKGRAKHEKVQVTRLLEGLQGHDWLKLMGVSGITDSKKKEYEPAREHFIRGCEGILDKFRTWREEEKRRKLERELALAEAEEEEERGEVEEEEEEQVMVDEDAQSDGDPPDYSDVDASAARQLHEEAIACSGPPRHTERKPKADTVAPVANEPEKEFKSFFAKPHLRASALGKHRRSGRIVSAWGHPVPEVPEQDFDLPEEYRDQETLKTHARRKRRDRRVSKP
ncbi:Uncharacterized protein BP5553_08544 [Venustampulla echinocandica]|uniref:Something about silencing protein 4 domain-containing protein n=1 Tax=Venustampulla echinocandica TaxID=2656787 RepID=A0A370TEI9_9HELO|nr:Uncharacterized protein BP5553_08544 [Venustampulla echinocandica]RDL33105.1 Uncharacterized protein BP5553_08544 [Venustampulla echinocandica]